MFMSSSLRKVLKMQQDRLKNETKEERAARQVYIIRQSSLSTAVELLGQGKSVDEVIKVAKQFETYVFDKSSSVNAINNIEDDIPA